MSAGRRRPWWPWALMAVAVLSALTIGVLRDGGARTNAERVEALSQRVACPTCSGQSVADSRSSASDAIREEIARQVEAGRTDGEIEAYLVSRFDQEILLTPPSSGIGGAVWALPVVALVAALAGLAVAFRRWRDQLAAEPTAEDRELVEAALRARHRDDGAPPA